MNKFLIKTKIVDILSAIKKRNRRFSPLFIARELNITNEEAVIFLNDLVRDGLLSQIFCVRCDECQFTYTFEKFEDIPFGKTFECPYNHETFVYEEKVQLWYRINLEMLNELHNSQEESESKKKEKKLIKT